jgi:hypothetical protein
MSPAFVGTNAYLITGNTGSTGTGDSAMGVTGTNPTVASSVAGNLRQTAATGAGTTCPLAIHQLVPDTAVVVSTTLTSSPSAAATFTVASTAGLQPGMQVICSSTGSSGMLAGDNAVVTAVNAGTSTITVSTRTSATNPAYTTGSVTATSGNTVTFVGYPEVIVGWNFGAHSYFISAGV